MSITLLASLLLFAQGSRDLKAGDPAPAVKLASLSDGKIFDMAANAGTRHTVLIFGSCT